MYSHSQSYKIQFLSLYWWTLLEQAGTQFEILSFDLEEVDSGIGPILFTINYLIEIKENLVGNALTCPIN